jgi:RNA polymerase sigma-54 factor
MDPNLKLSPERRLVMTYALRQSLEILQMTQLELAQWLRGEIEKNPLLELNHEKGARRFETELESTPTLYEHIQKQIRETFSLERETHIAEELANQLDERGFISSVEERHQPVLSILQTFDPPGIFARNLQESLLLQLKAKGKENSLPYQIVSHCFEDLLHGRYGAIRKKLNVSDLSSAISELSLLAFRPAHVFSHEPTVPILPDLAIAQIEGGWTIELIEDELPQFQMNENYETVDPETHEELETMRDYKTSAKWVLRSLNRRRKLLRTLGKILVCKQAKFLSQKGPISQLTIQELTEKLGVHESTLSRALAGKYVATPRGIIPLRSLITSSPETENARLLLEKLVKGENKKEPLTDEQLAKELKAKGYKVARRTISKYRGQLKIGSASQRKNIRRPQAAGRDDGIKSPSPQQLRSKRRAKETPPESSL